MEQQQRKALDLLPSVFYVDSAADAASWRSYITRTLQNFPTLSGFYGEGRAGSAPKFVFKNLNQGTELTIEVQFESMNGAFCITEILSQPLGVNTTSLMKLLPQLPYLKSFRARWWARNGGTLRQQPFPDKLAAVAPRSLEVLELSGLNLCCRLPEEWSSWKTIVTLLLVGGNPLVTGPLPDWVGMTSLESLDLASNDLTGTLPASYGLAPWSRSVQLLILSYNNRLSGTIPGTWAALSAEEIALDDTNITGCVPDQLINSVRPLFQFDRCSRNNTELLALKALKGILEDAGRALESWQEDPNDFVPDPLQGERLLLLLNASNSIFVAAGHALPQLRQALLHIHRCGVLQTLNGFIMCAPKHEKLEAAHEAKPALHTNINHCMNASDLLLL